MKRYVNLSTPSHGHKTPNDLVARIAKLIDINGPEKLRILREQLRILPSNIALYKTRDVAGSPTERILALQSVSSSCAAVLKVFERDEKEIAAGLRRNVMVPQILWFLALGLKPLHPESVITSGQAGRKLNSILNGVRSLKSAADTAIKRAKEQRISGRGGKRRGRDQVLQDVTVDLLELYRLVTGRDIGTSVDPETGEPTGPLIEFFALILPEIGWPMERKAIRSHIQRVRGSLPLSRDQILKNFAPNILSEPDSRPTFTADTETECGRGARSSNNEKPKRQKPRRSRRKRRSGG